MDPKSSGPGGDEAEGRKTLRVEPSFGWQRQVVLGVEEARGRGAWRQNWSLQRRSGKVQGTNLKSQLDSSPLGSATCVT